MVRLKKPNLVFWVRASKTEGRKTEGKTEGLLWFYQKTEGKTEGIYISMNVVCAWY